MNKKYEIQCAVRECTIKRDRKESVPIHRFPKRGDAGQRWIEARANSYLSRLQYFQVVERKFFVCYRHFDEQYLYQKRNSVFLLKCGAVPTLNLPSGSYMQCAQIANWGTDRYGHDCTPYPCEASRERQRGTLLLFLSCRSCVRERHLQLLLILLASSLQCYF